MFPQSLSGLTCVDLGCGSGRDCFVLSQMCGPGSKVIGIDMTTEQLATARAGVAFHEGRSAGRFGGVEFREGFIESFTSKLPADVVGAVDVIVSNCVINLSPDKEAVLRECYKALKPGGELYFSDV